jgi:hypothetical protein
VADPESDSTCRRTDWHRIGFFAAALVLATALVWAVKGNTVSVSLQAVMGAFGMVVGITTAVTLWAVSIWIIMLATRPARGVDHAKMLLWAILALVLAAAYTWGVIRWLKGDA